MHPRYIVPVEPAAEKGHVVVLEVQQEGSHPLDVRIVGCEGESPYVAKISHRNISQLKRKFKGTADEWEEILSHFLLQKQPEGTKAQLLEHVRMVYALKGDVIEITIQQNVKGIKVNLGEISLPRDDEYEFNPFEWAQVSAQAHTRSLQDLAALKAQANSEGDTIAKLKAQLDDFIKSKDEAETAMLRQFMELLNEKKRKIRDQNRLLAGAKVDESTAAAVQASREEMRPRKPVASRTSKRKAKASEPEPEPEPEAEPPSPSDADKMEIDQVKAEVQDDESDAGAATPDRNSDTETEDENDNGIEDKVPAIPARTTRASSNQPTRSGTATNPSSRSTSAAVAEEEGVLPPPRRELPFGKPATRKAPTRKAMAPVDDGEESDDEL